MRRLLLAFFVVSLLYVVSSCTTPVDTSAPSGEAPEQAVQPSAAPEGDSGLVVIELPVSDEAGDDFLNIDVTYPFLGSDDAPLTVVEYGDFSDGTNSFAATSQVASIKRDYVVSNKVKLVFKPYPLSGSEEAKRAAEASWCMWEQGSIQFWAYHNTLFAFYMHLDDESLNNYASRVPSVDKAALKGCLDSGKYAERVAATLNEGRQLGLSAVPAFIVGDETLAGNVPYKKLKAAIDKELGFRTGNAITGNVVFSQEGLYDVPRTIFELLKGFFRKI